MTFDDYMKCSPWTTLQAARYSDRALDAAVVRVIDTVLEWKMDYWHFQPGWPPVSVTAKAGEAPGGKGTDSMLIAYTKEDKDSPWHRECRQLMNLVHVQYAGAMLIQAARVRSGKEGTCWWSKRSSELFAQQDEALQRVGMRGIGIKRYPSVQAMQHAGREGRRALRESIRSRLGIKGEKSA